MPQGMSLEYYVLDTETTGLKAGYHEVNQIALIRVATGEEFVEKLVCQHPYRASQQALDIQKTARADLVTGTFPLRVIEEVDAFLQKDGKTREHRCIVAHNESFDRKFCHALWDEYNKEFKANLWLCTKKLAQAYTKKNGIQKVAAMQRDANVQLGKSGISYSLDNLMIGFGLTPVGTSHSAIGDSRNTVILFNHLMDQKLDYVRIIKREPHQQDKLQSATDGDYEF